MHVIGTFHSLIPFRGGRSLKKIKNTTPQHNRNNIGKLLLCCILGTKNLVSQQKTQQVFPSLGN